MGIPMICLLFVWYYKDQGLIVLSFGKTRLCVLSTGEITVHVKGVGSLTVSPLHSYTFPNYKEAYINFSHLENNWLS